MSRVVPLLTFGLTLVVGGMLWSLWDGSREFLDSFIIEDAYYILIRHVWAWIPGILIIVGIMCLIAAGISKSRERVVEY